MKTLTGELPQTAILALTACLLVITMLAASPAAGADNAAGAAVYKSKCVTCHGADGGGTAVGKSLKVADLRSAEVQSRRTLNSPRSFLTEKTICPGSRARLPMTKSPLCWPMFAPLREKEVPLPRRNKQSIRAGLVPVAPLSLRPDLPET